MPVFKPTNAPGIAPSPPTGAVAAAPAAAPNAIPSAARFEPLIACTAIIYPCAAVSPITASKILLPSDCLYLDKFSSNRLISAVNSAILLGSFS